MALKIACAPEYLNGNRLEDKLEQNSNRNEYKEVEICFFEEQEDRTEQTIARYDEKISEKTYEDVHLPKILPYPIHPKDWPINEQGTSKPTYLTEKKPAGTQFGVTQGPIEIIDLDESSNETTSLVSSAYKEGLKQKILERRRAEGKQMIDLAKEEEIRKKQLELTQHLTKEDIERRHKKRQQNNLAAKRCRENRKQLHIKMEKEFDIQISRRKHLLQAMKELRKEREMIEGLWKDCNRGAVTEETKRKIDCLIKTDYEKFFREHLQSMPFSLKEKNVVVCVDGHEMTEAMYLAQMFQVDSKKNGVHSGESTERSESAEEGSASGNEIISVASNSVNVPEYTDLTKDTKNFSHHVKSTNRTNEIQQNSFSARSTSLELAEGTYLEMTAEEELGGQIRKMEADIRESTVNVPEMDGNIDEDDFVPLVIDLSK